jgi:hypothetical protein
MCATPPRAVVSDDGREIRLIVYDGDGVAAAPVTASRALALAGELLAAARRRLR